ncbi:MAG: capsular biosynthesis protein [Bacteroidales bacterium]|nr:capsular biosynthesis protein [Bacteroidales bacterium]
MGIFCKQSLAATGILNGFTDWHSHILPGVDDGVKSVEDALAVLREYEGYGIKEVWLTPHIMEDVPNTTSALRARFDELCAAYSAARGAEAAAGAGEVTLHLAAENMVDNLFLQRLEEGDLLPLGDSLLVETSYYNPPMDLYEIVERIKAKGYYPVLAHPERYFYMGDSDYTRLRETGVRFQLNMLSLAGAYGTGPRGRALQLLKENAYSLVGTDLHNLGWWQDKIAKRTIPRFAANALRRIV